MKLFHYIITDRAGVHARPAGMIVKQAKKYESRITVIKDVRRVDAKNLLELMKMGIRFNDEIIVETEGPDEEAACTGMEKAFKETL